MRLIDADIIMDDLNSHADYADMLIKDIKEYIAEQPTIDAVPVVRCKECKYYSGIAYKTCIKIPYFWSEDGEGYCSLAERRTDG